MECGVVRNIRMDEYREQMTPQFRLPDLVPVSGIMRPIRVPLSP